jgi:hypothetical protein
MIYIDMRSGRLIQKAFAADIIVSIFLTELMISNLLGLAIYFRLPDAIHTN